MGLKKYDAKAKELENKQALEAKEAETDAEESEEEHELEEIEGTVAELTDTEKKVSEIVNTHKTTYLAYMKKQKIINSIVSAVVLLMGVGGMALVFCQAMLPKGVGLGAGSAVIIAAFLVLFITGRVLRNQRSQQALEYVDNLFEETNKYIYSATEFSNLKVQPRFQIDTKDFIDAHFYKGIQGTRSRNYCEVTYKNQLLRSADMAANVLVKGKTSPMFLGKYYDYPCKYEGETIILFQLKGKELSRPIDDVENLKLVDGNKKYNIYSNDENWNKVLNDKVLTELRSFRIDNTLIDIILSIRNGKVSLGIDYADAFMDIPVESEFSFENVRRAKRDLEKVLKVFDLLNK